LLADVAKERGNGKNSLFCTARGGGGGGGKPSKERMRGGLPGLPNENLYIDEFAETMTRETSPNALGCRKIERGRGVTGAS